MAFLGKFRFFFFGGLIFFLAFGVFGDGSLIAQDVPIELSEEEEGGILDNVKEGVDALGETVKDTVAALPGREPPDEYLIQSGDTLWDISARFFDDAYFWPKVWSYNPYITNPHWIYPGNRLVFRPGTLTEPPSVEVAPPREPGEVPLAEAPPEIIEGEEEVAKAPPSTIPGEETPSLSEPAEETGVPEESDMEVAGMDEDIEEEFGLDYEEDEAIEAAQITLREDGYITTFPERSLGKIEGSFMEIAELTQLQEVYLDMKRPKKVQVGDLYTIFRTVKHTLGAGYLNKILGIIEITNTKRRDIKGIITKSYYPIKRGDKIRAYYDPLHLVSVREPNNRIKGKIIERLEYNTLDIGQGDTIYIDQGKRQGVEAGFQFYILRRGDGITGDYWTYPDEVVGKVVVVVPRKNNSTAVVTYSTRAIRVGDRISTRKY